MGATSDSLSFHLLAWFFIWKRSFLSRERMGEGDEGEGNIPIFHLPLTTGADLSPIYRLPRAGVISLGPCGSPFCFLERCQRNIPPSMAIPT